MHRSSHKILIFSALFLFSACSNLQELREIAPAHGKFSDSLAAEYLAYSESEAEQGREAKAEYFAAKGVKSAKGESVPPDKADSKSVRLVVSRELLVGAMTDDVKRVAPLKSARAQLLFDCWNEREVLKISAGAVDCAEEFAGAYDELQAVADSLIHGAYSKKTLQFAMDSDVLDEQAQEIIKAIAAHMVDHSDYALELDAHYGAGGKKTTRALLAGRRFAAVRSALIKEGVKKDRIFAANKPGRNAGGAVILSSDADFSDSDEFDIYMTSMQHLQAEGK